MFVCLQLFIDKWSVFQSIPLHSVLPPFGRPLCITCIYAGIEIKTQQIISFAQLERMRKRERAAGFINCNQSSHQTTYMCSIPFDYYYYLLSVSIWDKPIESLAEMHWAARFMIKREYQRNSMHWPLEQLRKQFTLAVPNDFNLLPIYFIYLAFQLCSMCSMNWTYICENLYKR